MKSGPIIVVEDDIDDKEVLEGILKDINIPNKLVWFTKADEAFHYLKTTIDKPFIILSDVNMPIESGLEFKKRIDSDPQLRQKSIPFVFYSTSVKPDIVKKSYTEMTIQGFFKKGNSYDEIRNDIKLILDYWRVCRHPNSGD